MQVAQPLDAWALVLLGGQDMHMRTIEVIAAEAAARAVAAILTRSPARHRFGIGGGASQKASIIVFKRPVRKRRRPQWWRCDL